MQLWRLIVRHGERGSAVADYDAQQKTTDLRTQKQPMENMTGLPLKSISQGGSEILQGQVEITGFAARFTY